MGHDYLMIVLLWCMPPTYNHPVHQTQCRQEKIQCVRNLKNFTADDVVSKCLLGPQRQ